MADRYDTAKKMSGLSRGELGDILRELRRAAGFTQEELAARAGVSNRAISDIERAIIRRPRRETLRLLADALGLSAADRAALEDARQHASHRPAVPPVALSHALPDGLPTMQGPLIGRERERAAARVILQTEPARLLTVTGMGGVGKTRLALSVATDMQNTFADGAVFVSLAMVREGAFFFTAIANALGVRESPGEQVRDALLAYLRSRHLLLVLDNFEHLIEEAIEVANLLAHCPRLVALVTSREPLRIRGEHLLSLLPLTLPEDGADYAAIVASPAVSLFCQAAAAAAYTFALTPANGATVAAICAQLDGLPLALELAAAQLRLLSLDALFGRLATRLPELVGGPRDAPARQRTMRLAIAWSYDLLTVDEAAVFRRIAVFVGGCTHEAAVAVCDAVGDAATASHALASLMDKSLVQCQEQEPDVSRFTMLEVVREYAWERLVAHDEAAAVARDHALYFLTLAESTAPDLMGARTARSLRRLEEDHANLRAALRWTQQSGEGATGLRIAAALWRFWQGRGYLREGREWLELMLARTADTGEDVARARIEALIGAGMLAMRQGEVASAMALLTEGLARAYALGDPALIADALNALGYVALSREAFVQARVRYEEALALYRTLDDPWCIATALGNLANVAQRLGDNRGAVALCEESLHIHRTLRDEYALGFVLTTFGTALGFLGEIPRARGALIETLTMRQRLGDRAGIAVSLLCLGNLAMRIGQSAEAAAYFEESVAIGQEIGSHRTVGYALRGLGDSARARNCPGDAIRWYAQTLREIQYLRVPSILIRECERLIALAHELGQHERVAPLLAATHALRDSSAGNPPSLLTAQALLPVQARAALCDAAFAATWDAEAAGSLDRAIDAVLASPTDQDVCILATHSSLDPSPTWKGEGKEF